MAALLLGCGNKRDKRVSLEGTSEDWIGELTTIDMNPNCGADVVWDLDKHPLPFSDDTFDEVHAYDVLEHLGRQGDWRGWFDECADYWRILKPGGTLIAIVPVGADALADPGHTRFFSPEMFGFLQQDMYRQNLEKGSMMTDYRWYWKRNFNMAVIEKIANHHLAVVMIKA
jgi:SAM-dependent methyltransferase